ncbi:hypothetical protein [Listeria valentina]|uniref:hypothetical protein n=1 Tax=Listeria valentina TaxID=2705293 RepID=UPI00142F539E|nr:hypothetical protein [Listeria valentina]
MTKIKNSSEDTSESPTLLKKIQNAIKQNSNTWFGKFLIYAGCDAILLSLLLFTWDLKKWNFSLSESQKQTTYMLLLGILILYTGFFCLNRNRIDKEQKKSKTVSPLLLFFSRHLFALISILGFINLTSGLPIWIRLLFFLYLLWFIPYEAKKAILFLQKKFYQAVADPKDRLSITIGASAIFVSLVALFK